MDEKLIRYGFFNDKKRAIRVSKKINKPVYKNGNQYFVGSNIDALTRLNLKNILTGKIKKIR